MLWVFWVHGKVIFQAPTALGGALSLQPYELKPTRIIVLLARKQSAFQRVCASLVWIPEWPSPPPHGKYAEQGQELKL